MLDTLSGTKELIFDTSLLMFATTSAEAVSMRDIAGACNIRAGSIYNHFPSKQHILTQIYDYFLKVYPEIHRRIEQSRAIAENGTQEEFIDVLLPDFEFLPPKTRNRIILCTKLIYMRMHHDETARSLFLEQLTNSAPLKSFLEYAVEIGRLHPFDVDSCCHIITGYHNFIGIEHFVHPGYELQQTDDEIRFKAALLRLLPFRR